jgi:Protein of unknown function (DUF1579)
MKTLSTLVAFSLLAACNNAPKPSQTPEAAAKEFDRITTPGPMQQVLAAYAGKWKEIHTFRQDDQSGADTAMLEVDNELIVGGRYLQISEKGMMAGKPFEGIGMLGYDNLKDRFVGTWQDNVMTGILYFEGGYDNTRKEITLQGSYIDLEKHRVEVRQTIRLVDGTHYENDWYGTRPNQKEFMFTTKTMSKEPQEKYVAAVGR